MMGLRRWLLPQVGALRLGVGRRRVLAVLGYEALGAVTLAVALGLGQPPDGDVGFRATAVVLAMTAVGAMGLALTRYRSHAGMHAVTWTLVLADLVVQFLYAIRYQVPGLGTDSAVMSYTGAAAFLRGANPYAAPISPNFPRFNLPLSYTTFRMDGTFTDYITYPSLNFLPMVPLAALGIWDVRWLVLAFELFNVSLLLYHAPRGYRPLAILPFLGLGIVENPAGSVTDMIWLGFVLLAVLFWYRNLPWVAVALGLACAMKQQAWVLLPFLLVRVYLEAPPPAALRRLGLFTLGIVAAFLVPNLPFLVLEPHLWARAVLDPVWPMGAPMVSDGTGVVWMTIHGALPLTRGFYVVCVLATSLALLVLYAVDFRRLRFLVWGFPALISFVDYRSLESHIIYWALPLALELELRLGRPLPISDPGSRANLGARLLHRVGPRRATLATLVALLLAGSSAAVAYDGGLHPGLGLRLVVPPSDPLGWGAIDTLSVHISNPTDQALKPVLAVVFGSSPPLYWERWTGPEALPAGMEADYMFTANTTELLIPVELPFFIHVNDATDPNTLRVFGPFQATPNVPSLPNGRFQAWHRDLSAGELTPFRWSGIRTGAADIAGAPGPGVVLSCPPGDPGYARLGQSTPLPEVLALDLIPQGSGTMDIVISQGGHTLAYALGPPGPGEVPLANVAGQPNHVEIPLGADWRSRGWAPGGVGTVAFVVQGQGLSLTIERIMPGP